MVKFGTSNMGKRPHKRQKTEKLAAKPVQPLGAEAITHLLEDDASKDDEERRLESMLSSTELLAEDKEAASGSRAEEGEGSGKRPIQPSSGELQWMRVSLEGSGFHPLRVARQVIRLWRARAGGYGQVAGGSKWRKC